jgi:hypothetical protein
MRKGRGTPRDPCAGPAVGASGRSGPLSAKADRPIVKLEEAVRLETD